MNPQTHASSPGGQQAGASISLDDIYFTVFRHKRILLICLCLGLVGAVVVRFTKKPLYSSEAKLLVSYVVETKEINPNSAGDVHEISSGGESILNTEVEILSTQDLAEQVAKAVGPAKILANTGGGSNLMDAADAVASGISAVVSRRSDVMTIFFYHPDREVVQPVLEELIKAYRLKHVEAHQGLESGEEVYSEQLTQLRKRLGSAEEELKEVLTQAKVISIVEAKKTYSTQMEKLKNELLSAKAELYAHKAVLGEDVEDRTKTNSLKSPLIPTDKLEAYAMVLTGLDELRKRERELMVVKGYKEAHPLVVSTRDSMKELKRTRADLEQEYPGLALSEHSSSGVDLSAERAQVRALSAKVAGYEDLLTNLQSEALNLLTVEPRIAELERQRDQDARNLAYVSTSLEKARASEMGGNKVTGIKIVEKPTPPFKSNKKLRKMMLGVFAGFLALGLGISFVIDLVIDRTVKRSTDVRRIMRLPFFLSIPDTCWDGRLKLPRLALKKFSAAKSENGDAANGAVTTVMPSWDPDHHLRMYTEGLRERLITYFEVNGVSHKPKLVGVTSCGAKAGVSTLAGGVAVALSKTGDGNVLLVDMNGDQSATHHSFYKGEPGCGLADGLEREVRGEEQIQENLYLVSLRPSEGPGSQTGDTERAVKLLPSRFNKIMPELRASDYDYVIFDMPPVTPTSVTPRLASNMDMVLLVIESEKTPQQAASQAATLLADARVNASVVLNKCRKHVPALLSQEL